HALIRACLDPARTHEFPDSSAVSQLWTAGMQSLEHLATSFVPASFRSGAAPTPAAAEAWARRVRDAATRFRQAGIPIREEQSPAHDAGVSLYLELRAKAQPGLSGLARYLMFRWEEIAPYERT